MTIVVHTSAELSATANPRRAVVMTMGALHEGHASLIRAGRQWAGPDGQVVVSVFVNPLQFGPGEDFDRYPRTLGSDVAIANEAGADLVFAPDVATMYPAGEPQTRVVAGPLAEDLEGAIRPGHFGGMLTVVLKLLNLTAPRAALFGEKDYQQLVLIRQMVLDFNIGVEVVAVPTSRESDGLARSSRNRFLAPEHRRAAVAVSRGLAAGRGVAAAGGSRSDVLAAAATELAGLSVDYLELRGTSLEKAPASGETRLLVAVRFGDTRLLDNCSVTMSTPGSAREALARRALDSKIEETP